MGGNITVNMEFDLKTGKKNIVVDYESERDMTAHEHNERHAEIVKELLGNVDYEKEKPGMSGETRSDETGCSEGRKEQA